MKTLPLGTVIHGTMRNEDLIPAFVEALGEVNPKHEFFKEWEHEIRMIEDGWIERDPENAKHMVDDLFEALNDYCPPYCYFGAHYGDGSDYGVWILFFNVIDEEFPAILTSWYQTCLDDGRVRVNAGDEWPCVEMILEVNDHGNATLWIWDASEHRHVEAWSVA